MKKICLFLFIGVLTVLFGCQGTQKDVTPSVSEGYVTVDEGVDLRYKTVGDGPEAVFIPAAIYLEHEFEKLAGTGRTLIFYDQRGRGKSSPVADTSQISMDIEISDLEALRRHFGKEKVSLIGWSYLGGLVILYADRYPEHVNRVIQIGPLPPTLELYMKSTVKPMDKEDTARLKKMWEENLGQTDPEAYRTEFWNITMKSTFHDPQKIGLLHTDLAKCENEMPQNVNFLILAIVYSLGKWDLRAQVEDLDIPVLTIQGEQDNLPMEGARTWVSSLPDARLLAVPESGHLPFVEQPALFFPAVDTFLKGSWPEEAVIVSDSDEADR